MNRFVLSIAVAAFTASTAMAQIAIEESQSYDNWYLGINAGVASKTTHNSLLKNLNPELTLRLGRYWTPAAGWAVEGNFYFQDKQFNSSKNIVKAMNLNLLGTLNLSNWFGGYTGAPRPFEVVFVGGLGWLRAFDSHTLHKNALTSKFAFDFTLNLGAKKAWQLYLEPSINYNLTEENSVKFNLNYSALQLAVGVNYKFGNSNNTHYFKAYDIGALTDEVERLNAEVNELRATADAKDRRIAQDIRDIADLKDSLEAAKKVKPTTVINKVVNKVVNNNVLQPTVIFGQGKSAVDAAQMASVAMIAKYMKNHPESKILIKGYASPEGNPELNQRLSENRALSVRNVLVNRYGIAASRLSIQGMGATDELFDEIDFNRVATFTDTTK
ncbi:MAG: OmpA family protein [Prevotella sp.]|nr:OmpA family protein [Prevotella sp.]